VAQGDLEARLKQRLGRPVTDGRLDTARDVDLDRAASELLEQFRGSQDFDAFALLFELTYPRLHRMASGLIADGAAALEPDDLVSGLMTRIFTDVRRPVPAVRHFLGWARVSMRHELHDHWRRARRARAHDPDFQTALAAPPDPAQASAERELDGRLAGVARGFLGLVAECFTALEPPQRHVLTARDLLGLPLAGVARGFLGLVAECFTALEPPQRHVLTARDLLGLPYGRVARLLELPPEQVGMVIKRARARLVERVVSALEERPGGELRDLDANDRRLLVAQLLDRRGTRAMGRAVQRLLDVSLDAARARLADLVYELGKACLSRLPDFPERTLIHAPPRRASVVAGELAALSERLEAARRDVPRVRVGGEHGDVLDEVRRCLDVLAGLEGESGRQQVLRAMAAIHAGAPAEGERILRALDDEAYDARTRRRALVNLALALLRQDRHAEALAAARVAADRWPDSPVSAVNMLYATARLGDRDGFLDALRRLAQAQHSPWAAAWTRENLASLGELVGLTGTAMRQTMQREGLG